MEALSKALFQKAKEIEASWASPAAAAAAAASAASWLRRAALERPTDPGHPALAALDERLRAPIAAVVRDFVGRPDRLLRAYEHVLDDDDEDRFCPFKNDRGGSSGSSSSSSNHTRGHLIVQEEPKDVSLAVLELFARGATREKRPMDTAAIAERRKIKRTTVLCHLARCVAHGLLRRRDAVRLWSSPEECGDVLGDTGVAAVVLAVLQRLVCVRRSGDGGSSDAVPKLPCDPYYSATADPAPLVTPAAPATPAAPVAPAAPATPVPLAQIMTAVRCALAESEDDRVMAAAATLEYHHLHLVAAFAG